MQEARLINNNSVGTTLVEAKWDSIYEKCDYSMPADVLVENSFLLPKKGFALDLASGLGANAIFLAERGLDTHAWDISSVALKRLQLSAKQKSLLISVNQVFIKPDVLLKNAFDVIVVSRFLDRSLCDAIIACLKSGGLLFYQTYVKEKIDSNGPNNSDYLLARNELIKLFAPLNLVAYRENSLIGDLEYGERNEALFVAQKNIL